MVLYVMPQVVAFGGICFPLGDLILWLVSTTRTRAHQHRVTRNMPAPGSKAEKEMLERKARKGKPVKQEEIKGQTVAEEAPKKSGQRQQPVSKNRKKNKKR